MVMVSHSVTSVQSFYAYVVECSDGTLYTGWTTDLLKRIDVHNLGRGAKYTRVRLPVKLVASWSFESKNEAMRMEYQIKQLSKKKKEELIRNSIPVTISG